jgi:hypothetical protein
VAGSLWDHLDESSPGKRSADTFRGLQEWRRKLYICVSHLAGREVSFVLTMPIPCY